MAEANPTPDPLAKGTVTIDGATKEYGPGRSYWWARIAEGRFTDYRAGRRRLLSRVEIEKHLAEKAAR